MKPTFFDLVLQNSKLKNEQTPQNSSQPTKASFLNHPVGLFLTFFLFAFILYLGMGVISSKFPIVPSFSYLEIVKIYATIAVIKRIFS